MQGKIPEIQCLCFHAFKLLTHSVSQESRTRKIEVSAYSVPEESLASHLVYAWRSFVATLGGTKNLTRTDA